MTGAGDVPRLLEALARHRVLPPLDALPPNDAAFRALLGDIAGGERSRHAAAIRQVAAVHSLEPGDLAERARFLLSCLTLPGSGNHYEVLGVSPGARSEQIRKQWAALIRYYHPDHLGNVSGVDARARRLIEAWEALRDPERRQRYDAEMARGHRRPGLVPLVPPARMGRRSAGPTPWRWAPLGIVGVGLGVVLGISARIDLLPLPAAPGGAGAKPLVRAGLDHRGGASASSEFEAQAHRSAPSAAPAAPVYDTAPPARPSLPSRFRPPDPDPALRQDVREPPLAASAPELPAPDVDRPWPDEPLALIEAFREAYERKDLRAVMALFGSTVRDRDIAGREAVERLYGRQFSLLDDVRYEFIRLSARRLPADGDVVVEGSFRLLATERLGRPTALEASGPIRWLMRREDGELRIVAIDYEVSRR